MHTYIYIKAEYCLISLEFFLLYFYHCTTILHNFHPIIFKQNIKCQKIKKMEKNGRE